MAVISQIFHLPPPYPQTTPITSTSPPNLSLLPLVDANDPRTTSSFDSLPPFLPSTSTSPLDLLPLDLPYHTSDTSGRVPLVPPHSYLTSGSQNSETDSGAPLPFHHLLLADSQEVIPPPAPTPPLVRLWNIPGPTSTSTPSRRARNTYAPDSGPPLRNPVHVSISGTSGLSSDLGL
ncbi:uncharacterized protein EI90DRAFT_3124793 [Cantharellus anzutake]|uniref:uncharacterized protein n=1 Tax=Cantharellus anzutake TaxID=1750568 RepID=UPI001905CD64|nr:uncharacterized protein EI90DRAFT_3124793 [Cantharellus anzutake]KAF8330013.1 hypothetical protein EI90DRAFT_3124793 [Cantharellus anzutake]